MWKKKNTPKAESAVISGDSKLHVCAQCSQAFVYPVRWEERGVHAWWMLLRCGGCGYEHEKIVDNRTARLFDAELKQTDDAFKNTDYDRFHEKLSAWVNRNAS